MAWPIRIIGSRFSQIVESGPHKLTDAIRQIFMLDKVIFGKIGPGARLYIIRRRLMIVILLHPLTGNGEFVYSTRANCRSSLTPQNNLLGKLFIIFLIFMRSIVKSGNIHYCSHIIIDNGIRCIHPLCDRTGQVFTMTDFLQEIRHFRSFIPIPLFGNLISDTPHHHTRIITIMAY